MLAHDHHRTVQRRRAACGLSDPDAYLRQLTDSEEEWVKLVDAVVVLETWFFRDWEPFVFLRKFVASEWRPAHRGETLRVLSVPCSTGEEPYSIAMALLDEGLTANDFCIDAVDVSRDALDRGAAAAYDKHAFRGEHLEFRDRYFEQTAQGYRLNPEVVRPVDFQCGNILNSRFLTDRRSYDIIFCRNLLIYLDPAGQQRVVRVLDRLLAQDGVLFTGHVETSYLLGPGFVHIPHRRAFAYRKAPPKGQGKAPV